MDTKETARKILASGDLNEPEQYTLKDLFAIRDALEILKDYGFADLDLLEEVKKFIIQKVNG